MRGIPPNISLAMWQKREASTVLSMIMAGTAQARRGSSHTLCCPILDHQARDALEVLHVARNKGSAIGEGDGSNAQIHGTDAEPHRPQLLVLSNGWLCESADAFT